jgi:hypothetical protein
MSLGSDAGAIHTPTPYPSPQGGGGIAMLAPFACEARLGAALATSLPLEGRGKGWGYPVLDAEGPAS